MEGAIIPAAETETISDTCFKQATLTSDLFWLTMNALCVSCVHVCVFYDRLMQCSSVNHSTCAVCIVSGSQSQLLHVWGSVPWQR